jgi:DNA polymerase-3 subunit epsilon
MTKSAKQFATEWAKAVLDSPDRYYILDTETTGLNSPEIVELAIIDTEGNIIVNQRFNPVADIEIAAAKIHGIVPEIAQKYPYWAHSANHLESILTSRELLIYNYQFDIAAIVNTIVNSGGDPLQNLRGECVMLQYARFYGEWNHYRKTYKWQPLPGGDHSALGDCLATLRLIESMAGGES